MPRYLTTGLAVLLFAGVALVGLAAFNLLTQEELHSQTDPGGQTAQQEQSDQQPSNIRIYGDETYIDGEKVFEEPAMFDEPPSYFNQQNAVGGGPPGDAAPPINQQQATPQQPTPQQQQPTAQPDAAQQQMTPEQRQAALDQRQQELDQRQQQLDQREQELDQLEQELGDWEDELADWEAELEQREAALEDEEAALDESSEVQAPTGPPSLDVYDNVSGGLQRYEYDAPSGAVIQEQPALRRPELRRATPPMGPGEEDAPYWIFFDYY